MTSHTITSKGSFARAALTVLASGLVAVTATVANAAQLEADAPTISVSYADLNLATEQGTLALYRRIVSAAHQVCYTNTGPNARLAAQAQHCVDEAVARAVHDIQSPKLAELQAARARRVERG
jgi:UrcA family protein